MRFDSQWTDTECSSSNLDTASEHAPKLMTLSTFIRVFCGTGNQRHFDARIESHVGEYYTIWSLSLGMNVRRLRILRYIWSLWGMLHLLQILEDMFLESRVFSLCPFRITYTLRPTRKWSNSMVHAGGNVRVVFLFIPWVYIEENELTSLR